MSSEKDTQKMKTLRVGTSDAVPFTGGKQYISDVHSSEDIGKVDIYIEYTHIIGAGLSSDEIQTNSPNEVGQPLGISNAIQAN